MAELSVEARCRTSAQYISPNFRIDSSHGFTPADAPPPSRTLARGAHGAPPSPASIAGIVAPSRSPRSAAEYSAAAPISSPLAATTPALTTLQGAVAESLLTGRSFTQNNTRFIHLHAFCRRRHDYLLLTSSDRCRGCSFHLATFDALIAI